MITKIAAHLNAERRRLEAELEQIKQALKCLGNSREPKQKRRFSAAGRMRIIRAQRLRWKKWKKANKGAK